MKGKHSSQTDQQTTNSVHAGISEWTNSVSQWRWPTATWSGLDEMEGGSVRAGLSSLLLLNSNWTWSVNTGLRSPGTIYWDRKTRRFRRQKSVLFVFCSVTMNVDITSRLQLSDNCSSLLLICLVWWHFDETSLRLEEPEGTSLVIILTTAWCFGSILFPQQPKKTC